MYICLKCNCQCDIATIDMGGKEEIWGRMEHVPVLEDVSDCCHSEFKEIEDAE